MKEPNISERREDGLVHSGQVQKGDAQMAWEHYMQGNGNNHITPEQVSIEAMEQSVQAGAAQLGSILDEPRGAEVDARSSMIDTQQSKVVLASDVSEIPASDTRNLPRIEDYKSVIPIGSGEHQFQIPEVLNRGFDSLSTDNYLGTLELPQLVYNLVPCHI